MIKRLSTIHLLGILAVLVLIFLALEFTGNQSRSSSFRETLVEIDTLQVTKVIIAKGTGDPFEISRSGNGWEIKLSENKVVPAVKSSVKNSLSTLQTIKPSRLVANQKEKWAEYQVDTAGTRVQIFEDNKEALDLVIGRFGVQGQRSFYTYVRLSADSEVYAAADFMGISFGSEPSSYRFKELLRLVKDSVNQFSFDYPEDSSFTMTKSVAGPWVIEGVQSDSASTQTFINSVRFLSGTDFVDDISRSALGPPIYSVLIAMGGADGILVEAFSHPVHNWVLNSSHNANSWFSDPERKLVDKLFPAAEQLLDLGNPD